jgi:inorganic triphosphatase YgiF
VRNDETDRYLDTADGRLADGGWACRLRTRRVAGASRTFISLKGPPEATSGALHRRPEVEGPASDAPDPVAWPPSAARDLLDGLRAGAPLIELIRLEQVRLERSVSLGGSIAGTLSLDEVTALLGDGRTGELQVVELELRPGVDAGVLKDLAGDLEAIRGLTPERATKLELALGLAAAPEGARP